MTALRVARNLLVWLLLITAAWAFLAVILLAATASVAVHAIRHRRDERPVDYWSADPLYDQELDTDDWREWAKEMAS